MLHFRNNTLITLLLLQIVSKVMAGEVKTTSKLQVHIPKSMYLEGGYEHREALFGIPPYGGSITQNVYYAADDLCESQVNTHIGYPERSIDESGKQMSWPTPFILMVDRGGCTFVTKVRNAQRSGAAAVLIADNTCLCSAGDRCTNEGSLCEDREPIMADDGSGSDISIPSFLMFKQDADEIKFNLMQNQLLQMQMSWALPAPDDRVEYSLWSTPTEPITKDFEKHFKHAAIAYGDKAYFSPHTYIYDGLKAGCSNMGDCPNLCTNNGRYCANDPDDNLYNGISGADVVKESLRRTCIWNIYGYEDGVGEEWWSYVNGFEYECASEGYFQSDECIKSVYEMANINEEEVEKCMTSSGGLEGDVENGLLKDELDAIDKAGIVILPSMIVNNVPIRGGLEFANAFGAVCAGYAAHTAPSICKECSLCPDLEECVFAGSCSSLNKANASVSTQTFNVALLGLSAFFMMLGLIQYKRSKDAVRDQVKGIVAEYMPLDIENKEGSEDEHEIS